LVAFHNKGGATQRAGSLLTAPRTLRVIGAGSHRGGSGRIAVDLKEGVAMAPTKHAQKLRRRR